MLKKHLLPLLLICFVVAVAATATTTAADAAVTCSTVYNYLEPCLGYVIGGGSVPPDCCSGLKSLIRSVRTITGIQSACKCMKSVASSANGPEIARAASIPGICKVKLPFRISANTDCSKIK